VDATAVSRAGFDIVHAFDAHAAARVPGLEMLADPARRLGLLVGNTRALWPHFLAAWRGDRELAADPDPLDRYTERTIDAAFAGERVWLGHRTYDGTFIPLQRLAEVTGLAYLAPTHLSIHPTYGPWFALRAIVLLHGDRPTQHATIAAPCRCASACASALEHAMSSKRPESWIAVRDACPIGREHRYPEDQLRYHYTKDRSLLR
jgi:cyanocobalamin reductase (cyanide-eliminating) / alkylcobalamin dealkylase